MNYKYEYIPNKENLTALYNDTYNDIIRHNVRNSIPIIHEDIVKDTIFTICTDLFLENHHCRNEEICSENGSKEFGEIENVVCKRLNMKTERVGSENITYAIIFIKEFEKIVSNINPLVIPQKYVKTFTVFPKGTTAVNLVIYVDKEYSDLKFLDKELESIATISVQTPYAKHLNEIYNKKEYYM
ncbi:hypothetical protein [Staphylococcus simulans]|uniref:hypothetical protein n=1 Tax=Staphylococcus simulans TaxID=1286 RepID=UPI000D1D6AF1|nr:hypothetical protein [Staphylococcus simulans]PTJ36430.1 hypothetical protein BU024_10225 [Staphylococcus simulans]